MIMFFSAGYYDKSGSFCFEKFTRQCRFKGGTTVTNTSTYTPTSEEIRLQKQSADYSEAVAPNALRLNNTAAGLLWDSLGSTQVDYTKLNNDAQRQIASAQGTLNGLLNGKLPAAYEQNMQDIINRGVQRSSGNLLNNLAQRGVINSSVTSQGLKDISDSAANAMADAYTQNIGLLSQLSGQQIDSATAGITAGAAAQEAAQQPALNLWNASLGLNGSTTGALGAAAGKGTTTSTQTQSGGGGFWGGLASGIGTGLIGLFCFIGGTKIDTPHGKVKLRDIKKGDKVISFNQETGEDEICEVLKVSEVALERVFAIQTVDKEGKTHHVVTTPSQPLMRYDGSYVTLNNIIICKTELKSAGIVKGITYNGKQPVFDLCVSGPRNYYANGFIAKDGSGFWGKE